MMCFGKDNSGSFQTAVCPKLYQKNCVTKVTTVQHRHSGKVRFRDRIEAFVLNALKIGKPFHILKAETVDNGRKGGRSAMYYIAVLTNRCRKLFRQSSGSKMRIDFRDAFPADLWIRHLQHTGTIAGFGLIAMDGKILIYFRAVIVEGVLCTV